MAKAVFFRPLNQQENAGLLTRAISALNRGERLDGVYFCDLASFKKMPGSPFAYWVSEDIKSKFYDLKSLAEYGVAAQVGASTKDDFRFLRTSWEPSCTGILSGVDFGQNLPKQARLTESDDVGVTGKKWIPFAKGGSFSRFYSDIHLLINWGSDGKEIEEYVLSKYPYLRGDANWVLHRESNYLSPGITWSRRTTRPISVRVLPAGCLFADKGPSAFAPPDRLLNVLGLMNSNAWFGLLSLQLGAADSAARSYEIGLVQNMPTPDLTSNEVEKLGALSFSCFNIKRALDSVNETSHVFKLPALVLQRASTLAATLELWRRHLETAETTLAQHQAEIDSLCYRLYGIGADDRVALYEMPRVDGQWTESSTEAGDAGNEEDIVECRVDAADLTDRLVSYLVGCVFGRWDIRFALDSSLLPGPPGCFHSLPTSPWGTLVSPDSLPARSGMIVSDEWLCAHPNAIRLPPIDDIDQATIPDDKYLLQVEWDGILVDDEGHTADIVSRVRDVLTVIWSDNSANIESEICGQLDVGDLRAYFRRTNGFFSNHLPLYTKSRRKAPIYWPLSTRSGSYTLWIYYPRITSDTLYAAINQFVSPKIDRATRQLEESRQRLESATGSDATNLRSEIEQSREFLGELKDMRDELLRIASLPYQPNLDDGVIINAAPFWKLFRHTKWSKDTKATWQKLEQGEYDWAHLAFVLWPERVREKCRTDKSLAIAHGLADSETTQQ